MRYCEECDRKTKQTVCNYCERNTGKLTVLKRISKLPSSAVKIATRNYCRACETYHFGEECDL